MDMLYLSKRYQFATSSGNALQKCRKVIVSSIFEEEKVCVELMNKVSNRWHKANSVFLTVNTILITASTGFVALTQEHNVRYRWVSITKVASIIFCQAKRWLIQCAKQVGDGKSETLSHLPESTKVIVRTKELDIYEPFVSVEGLVIQFRADTTKCLLVTQCKGVKWNIFCVSFSIRR